MKEKNKAYKINLANFVWGTVNNKFLLIRVPGIPDINASVHFLKRGIFVLNGLGLEIWKMLIKDCDLQEILKELSKKCPATKKQIQADLIRFINQLKKSKIINELR